MRSHEQASRRIGKAANAGASAQFLACDLGNARIELPQHFAGCRIDRENHAVASGDVEDPVDGQRCGLRVADVEIERPRELQAPDRLAIDLRERAVVGLACRTTDRRPVTGVEFGA